MYKYYQANIKIEVEIILSQDKNLRLHKVLYGALRWSYT